MHYSLYTLCDVDAVPVTLIHLEFRVTAAACTVVTGLLYLQGTVGRALWVSTVEICVGLTADLVAFFQGDLNPAATVQDDHGILGWRGGLSTRHTRGWWAP